MSKPGALEWWCCNKLMELSDTLVLTDEYGVCLDGCCGGCFAISEMKYCPFCASPLHPKKEPTATELQRDIP